MNKVKVGIVGLGRLGSCHAKNIAYKISNAELIAACSVRENELEFAKSELKLNDCYDDFEKMVRNADIEAVAIVSSSNFHNEHIQIALDANKHVFTDKPLGLTMEECIKSQEAVNKHKDQVFMIGFMRRYDPSYAYAKQKIMNGDIGKPFAVRCTSIDPESTVEGAIVYGMTSGGLFLDMTTHDIDLARWFLEDEPQSVYTVGGAYMHKEFEKMRDADNAFAIMKFINGGIATFYSGRDALHGYHIETEIIGPKGTIRIGAVPQKNLAMVFNEQGAVQECVSYFPERFAEAYLNEMQEFIDCIQKGNQPGVGVKDGVECTRIAYAMTKAYRTGTVQLISDF